MVEVVGQRSGTAKVNRKSVIASAKWLAGVAAYVASSVAVSRVFTLLMLHWARAERVSRGIEFEIHFLWWPVISVCLFWGALYASALAKPAVFGGTAKILKHLGYSYSLCLLGAIPPICIQFFPLPDLPGEFAVSAFIFVALAGSVLCFVSAIAVWVRLAFGRHPASTESTPPDPSQENVGEKI